MSQVIMVALLGFDEGYQSQFYLLNKVPDAFIDEAERAASFICEDDPIHIRAVDNMEMIVISASVSFDQIRQAYKAYVTSADLTQEEVADGTDQLEIAIKHAQNKTLTIQPERVEDNILDIYIDDDMTLFVDTAHTSTSEHYSDVICDLIANSRTALCTSVADGLARLSSHFYELYKSSTGHYRIQALAIVDELANEVDVPATVAEMEGKGLTIEHIVLWFEDSGTGLTIVFK